MSAGASASSGLQRAVIRLIIVLVGVGILRMVLSGVGMLQQQISPFSPVSAMTLIDALLALIVIGILWSFRESIAKQLSVVYGRSPDVVVIVTGIIGLLVVGFAYYSYYFLALISLGWQLMWIYNVLFLLLAFAAAFRLVETILVRLTKGAGPSRLRSRR